MSDFVGPPIPTSFGLQDPAQANAGLPAWLLIPTGLAPGHGPQHLIPVDSSWVHAYGWADGVLVVQFQKDGAVTVRCRYDAEVPLSMWQDFQMAPSKGVWVHRNIINLPYTPI